MQNQLPRLLHQLLERRGFGSLEDQNRFLYPSLQDLKDPATMYGMDIAIERLALAHQKQSRLCVYADFDLDGTSGLALLFEGLKGLGFQNVLSYQPLRIRDGYGFHVEAVEQLKQKSVELILTVDVGITAYDAVDRARELGIDVIITDHHLPGEVLPRALVIVNPNLRECTSGLGYLSGVGVAFYLLRALRRRLGNSDLDLKDLLEYFTIGTLTDMVPLVADNRVLIKHGLNQLKKTRRWGLLSLLKDLGMYQRDISSQEVALRVAPRLNALSRMEASVLPLDLLLTEDQKRAEDLIVVVAEQNKLRQTKQRQAEEEAIQILQMKPERSFDFVFSSRFHPGVVGLVATHVSQTRARPAWVGVLTEDGLIKGSARVPQGLNLCLVKAMNAASGALERFGGHSRAAGFVLKAERAEEFENLLEGYFASTMGANFGAQTSSAQTSEADYELIAHFRDLNPWFMRWYDFLGPYGTAFPVPIFRFEGVEVIGKKVLRGGHVRLTLKQDGLVRTGLVFSPSISQAEFINKLETEGVAARVDLEGEVQGNTFRGETEVQILIRGITLSKI